MAVPLYCFDNVFPHFESYDHMSYDWKKHGRKKKILFMRVRSQGKQTKNSTIICWVSHCYAYSPTTNLWWGLGKMWHLQMEFSESKDPSCLKNGGACNKTWREEATYHNQGIGFRKAWFPLSPKKCSQTTEIKYFLQMTIFLRVKKIICCIVTCFIIYNALINAVVDIFINGCMALEELINICVNVSRVHTLI